MKINHSQKRTLIIGLILIAISLLVWIGYGSEIFTKTEVLIEKNDELLGISYKEWKDKLILGLDYVLGFIGIIVIMVSILLWKQRSKSI
ncbi:MAG TPA: hypothetical protein ENN33_09260 [Ignavibacteria bacterium]|nr:hypothetical protein [Ignavibacteria bacterium]